MEKLEYMLGDRVWVLLPNPAQPGQAVVRAGIVTGINYKAYGDGPVTIEHILAQPIEYVGRILDAENNRFVSASEWVTANTFCQPAAHLFPGGLEATEVYQLLTDYGKA